MAKGIELPPSSLEHNNGVSAAPYSEWRLTPARLLAYSIPPPSPPRSLPCFKPLDRSRKKIDAYIKRREALLLEFGRLDDLARLDDTPTEKAVDLKGNKGYLVIVIMGVSIVVMFALAAYCQTFKSKLVRAYADDHLFDALTNVVGLASAILAAKFRWWIDPLGALVLALYTILCWTGKVKKNVRRLVARSAPPEMLQKITYVCWNHDERISKIDTVRAYTSGDKYVAEVDIVLPKETPLVESHDIGEALQNKLEKLPYLERAFVHVNYDTCHKPQHF